MGRARLDLRIVKGLSVGRHEFQEPIDVGHITTPVATDVENHTLGIGIRMQQMTELTLPDGITEGAITDIDDAVATESGIPAPAPKKNGDTRPVRGNRAQQAAKKQLTICESAIAKLEEQCAALDAEMERYGSDAGKLAELYAQKQETEARLEIEMSRWEELSLQLEE